MIMINKKTRKHSSEDTKIDYSKTSTITLMVYTLPLLWLDLHLTFEESLHCFWPMNSLHITRLILQKLKFTFNFIQIHT